MSELHLYEGTEFESARDGALAKSGRVSGSAGVQKAVSGASRLAWFRRAAAHVILRKSYSRV